MLEPRLDTIKNLATVMVGQQTLLSRTGTLEKILDELAQLSGDLDNRVLELSCATEKIIKIYTKLPD